MSTAVVINKLAKSGMIEKEAFLQAVAPFVWPALRLLGTGAFTYLSAKGALDSAGQAMKASDWKGKLGHGSMAALNLAMLPFAGVGALKNLALLPNAGKAAALRKTLEGNVLLNNSLNLAKNQKVFKPEMRVHDQIKFLQGLAPRGRDIIFNNAVDPKAAKAAWQAFDKGNQTYANMTRGLDGIYKSYVPKGVQNFQHYLASKIPGGPAAGTALTFGGQLGAGVAAQTLVDNSKDNLDKMKQDEEMIVKNQLEEPTALYRRWLAQKAQAQQMPQPS